MRKWLTKCIVIPIVILIDLITKILFEGQYFVLIPKLLSVYSHHNTGAAWGFLSGKLWLLLTITIVFLVAILLFDWFFKNNNLFYNISISLIIGGALGNLIDRIFLGYVRDFIRFEFWPSFPIFNIADSCLFIGAVLLTIYILFFYKEKKKS